jgi:oxepin-CoA hydrolase/3-oxo-5,6-dehydrosuberyl-CoA semialdehyde dehydrogenase
MPTIAFDVNDSEVRDSFLSRELLAALASLREDEPPRWGRMTAQQMVEHLVWAFELSTGRAATECTVPPDKLDKVKAFLYDNRPTPAEFMNPALVEGLPPLRYRSLAEAKAALALESDRFLRYSRDVPDAAHTHPIFGRIGVEEWSRTHFKHCFHHLKQFGLVTGDDASGNP